MTQADVAGDRFTKAYISALETGAVLPSMTSLQFLAERMQAAPDWFIAEEQDEGEIAALPSTITRGWYAERRIYVELDDGRVFGLPIERSRKLMTARLDQLEEWRVTEYGRAIAWPSLGEEIGLEDFLGVRVMEPDEVTASTPRRSADRGDDGTLRRRQRASRYDPLTTWLMNQRGRVVEASFDELEEVIGRALPPSARRYAGPWSSKANPLGAAIIAAGWRPHPNLAASRIRLTRR